MVFAASWVAIGVSCGIYRAQRASDLRCGEDIQAFARIVVWAIAWPLFLPLLIWGRR